MSSKHISILDVFEGDYLNFSDTQTWDGPKTVTIEDCNLLKEGHVFKDHTKLQRDAYELKFKGAKKKMLLNKTNSNTLVQLYPGRSDPKDYIGEKITLFGNKNVYNPKTGGRGGVSIKI